MVNRNGKWETVDGAPVDYKNFKNSASTGGDCVAVDIDGYWFRANCNFRNLTQCVICMKKATLTTGTVS